MHTIDELKEQAVSIFRKYEETGTNRWSADTVVMDLSYQIGSLAKLIMCMRGNRNSNMVDEKLKEQIGDEISDILADILYLSNELDIDIGQAWENMLSSDGQKISQKKREKLYQ
ncbi:hypothetical protein HJ526_04805 [Donghicola sp. C2-DW-16]|uniref:NTP pyrophosphohydrolase MazG putative catalytic core domain-containing protein n=1 Tax=Donghicola mangrovi TaxID=2729614 RepID=A0ABX2PCG6_9RHOB|nr:hypothetical protein [Donghicola mangrovi]NVO26729.1 hypothetical protein [Donghicola mangrovi]